ncbi:tyrosine-type recombinase/integrase [Microbacterium sp. M1A1_1b]
MNLKEFRNHLNAAGLAQRTVHQRLYHLEVLRRTHPDLLTVTIDDLEQFLANRRHQSAEYRKSFRSTFRSYYAWAHRRGLIDTDPAYGLKPIAIPKRIPRVAVDDDVSSGLTDADARQTAIILLGRACGLRLSEITSLRIQDRQYAKLIVRGKGDKERVVPLDDPELIASLDALEHDLGTEGYYFPGRFGGHQHITTTYKVVRDRVGINTHALRHAAGTAAYDTTHDLRAVQEWMGHASSKTTEIYTHVSGESLRSVSRATTFRRAGNLVSAGEPPPGSHLPLAA